MVVIGERLGLYKALAAGPMTSAELAAKTQTDERYLREWLASQAAGGYITYDETSNKFSLTEEQAFTLAKEDSPPICREPSNWLWDDWPRSLASPIPSAAAPVWGGTSTLTTCSRVREVLSTRICRESGRQLDPRSTRRKRKTRVGRTSGRCWLR